MRELRFKVFGTLVTITGAPGAWQACYPGSDGKRRPADFIVPHDIPEDGLGDYLADLFHEDATPRRPKVLRLPRSPQLGSESNYLPIDPAIGLTAMGNGAPPVAVRFLANNSTLTLIRFASFVGRQNEGQRRIIEHDLQIN